MSDKQVKDIRKQIRNVLQENLSQMLTSELVEAVSKQANDKLNTRLDSVESYVKETLTKNDASYTAQLKSMDDRAKAIYGYITREVAFTVANKLHNMQVTMDAFTEVMAEHAIQIPDLNAKIDAKKLEIQDKLKKAAEAKMADNIASKEEDKQAGTNNV